jgi:hypothetical protein
VIRIEVMPSVESEDGIVVDADTGVAHRILEQTRDDVER